MKKVTVIITMMAIVLGLSQCRKPDFSQYGGHWGQKEAVEFTTSYDGGGKGQFDPPTPGGVLHYKWDINNDDGKIDHILVFVQDGTDKEITEETKFTGGKYLGTIPIVDVSADGYSAKFKGYLEVPSQGVMRFVHLGQDVSVDKGSANVDFSTQDCSLGQISGKIVAICDKPYTEIKPFTNCRLHIQYAIAYVDFSAFGSGDVSVFNNAATVLNLNSDGNVTYSGQTTMTLQDAANQNGSYFAIMPSGLTSEKADPSPRKYTFYANHKLKDLNLTFNIDGFYSVAESDRPAVIAPDVDGIFPDLFSVSDETKVRFSTGNLQYLGKTSEWRFAEKQWHHMGDGGGPGSFTLEGYTEYNPNTDATDAARDLFGWGCTGYQDNRSGASTYQYNFQPYSTEVKDYGANTPNRYGYGPDYYDDTKYNLTVGSHSDWGCLFGVEKGWRTLTEDEFYYLLVTRTYDKGNASKINEKDARYAMVSVNGVKGVIVFPDVFVWPEDVVADKPTVLNELSGDWNGGVDYVGDDFTKLEKSGVVFFPAGGQGGFGGGTYGLYWTSSCINAGSAYSFAYCNEVFDVNDAARCLGRSVRLAR